MTPKLGLTLHTHKKKKTGLHWVRGQTESGAALLSLCPLLLPFTQGDLKPNPTALTRYARREL